MGVGKKVKDRKQRALVDTDRRALALQAHALRSGSRLALLTASRRAFPFIRLYSFARVCCDIWPHSQAAAGRDSHYPLMVFAVMLSWTLIKKVQFPSPIVPTVTVPSASIATSFGSA